jgi:hypothetical protein
VNRLPDEQVGFRKYDHENYPAEMYNEIPISYLSITIAIMVFKMIIETKKK